MKKIFLIILTIIMVLTLFTSILAQVDDSDIKSYLYYDSTFEIYGTGKNINTRIYPASITKIVTAMVVLDQVDNLDKKVIATQKAIGNNRAGGSSVGIEAGESLSYKVLLEALLINSANEAAYILAENVAGDLESFIDLMNNKAKELGATNTNFVNPCGLHEDTHYSTASDIIIFAKKAMSYSFFKETVAKKSYTMPVTNIHTNENWSIEPNTNLLLTDDIYLSNTFLATGIKTGTTPYSGYCLLSSAVYPDIGNEIILVTLGASTEESLYTFTHQKLTEIKETFYSEEKIYNKDTAFAKLNYEGRDFELINKDDIYLSMPVKYDIEDIDYTIETNDEITLPIKEDFSAGTISFYYKGHLLKQTPLKIENIDLFNTLATSIEDVDNSKSEKENSSSEKEISDVKETQDSTKSENADEILDFDLVKIIAIISLFLIIIVVICLIRKEVKKINRASHID